MQKNYLAYVELYKSLSPELKHTDYSFRFLKRLSEIEPMTKGKQFREIIGQDLNGEAYHSNFTGHTLTLVNFWSPNERVSREEMANLIPVYLQFKEQGFNIISVAFTKDLDTWKKAVKQDGFIWPQHYSDGKIIERSQNGKPFDIDFVPENYLIDGSGKIITKDIDLDSLVLMLKKL